MCRFVVSLSFFILLFTLAATGHTEESTPALSKMKPGSKGSILSRGQRDAAFAKFYKLNLLGQLESNQIEKVENLFQNFYFYDSRDQYGYSLLSIAYESLLKESFIAPNLKQWIELYPDSHFPYVLRGQFNLYAAMKIRIYRFPGITSEKKREKMNSKLKQAQKDLEKAAELNPNDPNIWARMIMVCYLSELECDPKDYFNKAIELDPKHMLAHISYMETLFPQRTGGSDKTLEFAREVVKSSGADDGLKYLPVYAHQGLSELYQYNNHELYFQNAEVYRETKHLLETMIREDSTRIQMLNLYARYSVTAKDYELAKKMINLIGVNVSVPSWGGLQAYFDYRQDITDKDDKTLKLEFIQALDQAIAKDPENANHFLLRGWTIQLLPFGEITPDQFRQSEKDMKMAYRLRPGDYDFRFKYFKLKYGGLNIWDRKAVNSQKILHHNTRRPNPNMKK